MRQVMAILMAGMIVAAGSGVASAVDFASICSDYSAAADSQIVNMMGNSNAVDLTLGRYPEVIFGTTPTFDPWSGQIIQVPIGFDQNWSNGLGDYIQSNDRFYDPNMMPGPTFLPMIPVYGQ